MSSGGSGEGGAVDNGLRIAELCAGDGSLAAKLIAELEHPIAAYTLFERNALLSQASAAKTDGVGTAVNIDCCSAAGEAALAQLTPRPDIWIASGSVLCGQVGSYSMAQPLLSAMTASLAPGGFLVVTGFTQSYLHPQLFVELGLRLRQASLPSEEACGLESGFGRFHLFVLDKPGVGVAAGAAAGAEEAEHRKAHLESGLRQAMLSGGAAAVGSNAAKAWQSRSPNPEDRAPSF